MYDGRILICLIHNQNLKDLGFCQKIPHWKIFLVLLHHDSQKLVINVQSNRRLRTALLEHTARSYEC